jgi:TPR repeat protein
MRRRSARHLPVFALTIFLVLCRTVGEPAAAEVGQGAQAAAIHLHSGLGREPTLIADTAAGGQQKVTQEEEAASLQRAEQLLQTGDIVSARMIFERIGKRGSAKGAYSAGRTYDPEFFKSMKIVGMTPNLQKAKEWYMRAAELGDPDAARRLFGLAHQ